MPRAATLLVKHPGSVVVRRGDKLLSGGHVEGCGIWKRIIQTVAEVLRTRPAEGSG
jgi:hypothetical protein